jgi:hypothetical protein
MNFRTSKTICVFVSSFSILVPNNKDNSSLISYYNTQNALKVKLHWRNNMITTHKHVLLFMSQFFNTRDWLISYI